MAAKSKPSAAAPPLPDDDVVDDAGQPLKLASEHDDVVDDNGKPITSKPSTATDTQIAGTVNYADLNVPSAAEQFLPGITAPNADPIAQAGKSIGTGVGKGLLRFGTGAGKVIKGAATGDFGPYDEPGVQSELDASLASKNPAEKVGAFVGESLPYLLPSNWINAGARIGAPLAVRLGSVMWREALADASIAYLGSGGDPKTAVATGATGGLVRGALSTPLFLRDSKLAQAYLQEAQTYGIPLTKAEQTQSAVGKLVESMVRRSVGGFRRFAKFDVERNELLKGVADKIVHSVDPATMDPRSMGVFVKDSIDQVRTAAGQELSQAADQVFSGPAGQLKLDLGTVDSAGKFVPGELSKAAQEIIDSRSLDKLHNFLGGAGGDADSLNQAYRLLDRVAKPFDTIKDPVAEALGYSGGKIVPRQLDVATAKELRTMLFDMTNFSDSTVGKGAIKRLNGELHNALVDTLDKSGFQKEAQAWEAASANYKKTLDNLEVDVLKPLIDKDMPETVARVLSSGNGESAVIALSKVIKPAQMARVRGAMANEMVHDALHPNGLFMVDRFKRSIDNMGQQGMDALYGPQLAKELTDFAKTAERFKIVPGTKETAEGMRLPFMAQIALSSKGGLMGGLIAGGVTGSPKVGASVIAGTIGYEGAKIVTSSVLARMMTKPAVVSDLTRALTVDPLTTAGKQLFARIGAYAAKAATELQQENARHKATNEMRQEAFGLPPTQ